MKLLAVLVTAWVLNMAAVAQPVDTAALLADISKIEHTPADPDGRQQLLLHKISEQCRQAGFSRGQALCVYLTGRNYVSAGDYARGIDCILQAKEIFLKTGDLEGCSRCCLQLGVTRYSQKQYAEAIADLKEQQTLLRTLGRQNKLGQSLYLAGLCFTEMAQYDSAENTLLQACRLNELFHQKKSLTESQTGLADVYLLTGKLMPSLTLYLQCADSYGHIGDVTGEAWAVHGAGQVYLKLNQPQKALHLFEKAYRISEKQGNLFRRDRYAASIAEAYRMLGKFEEAYTYFTLSVSHRDSVFSNENKRAINNLKSRLDLERKQKELDQVTLQRAKDRVALYVLLAAVLAVLLAASLIYGRYRHKLRANRELTRLNANLEQALTSLKAAQEQLVQQEKLASLGQLTAGIAHEIKNPLNFVNNFAKLSMDLLDELNEESDSKTRLELSEMLHDNLFKIFEHGNRASTIVQGMLLHSRSGHTELQPTNVNDLAESTAKLAWHGAKGRFSNFNCQLTFKLQKPLPQLLTNQQDLGRVILNLVDNALYATYQKQEANESFNPEIVISTRANSHEIQIDISDNGNGVPAAIKDQVFDPFFTTKPAGEGTGLGLSLSHDIVKSLGGKLILQSEPGIGSTFSIHLPAGGV